MTKFIAWTDVESTGVAPEVNSLLEVAVVLSDFFGNVVSPSYTSLVKSKNVGSLIEEADDHVLTMHERSGLWNDLWKKDAKTPEEIDRELVSFLGRSLGPDDKVYLGGNSPALDRRYVELYLPNFFKRLSHMMIDVTTLSLVLQESGDAQMFMKQGAHRALPDAYDSLEEYCHYLRWLEA